MKVGAAQGPDWAKRASQDASLRRFVEAEIARAGVDVATARADARRWEATAKGLHAKLAELQTPDEKTRESNRRRQLAGRRRHEPGHGGVE